MAVKTNLIQTSGSKGNEQVHRRDEQIRRILSAAQYKKYKEAEKAFKSAIKAEKTESAPVQTLNS